MAKSCKVSLDPAPCEMVEKAGCLGVETLWDRYQAVLSQCGSTGCGAGALMRHGSMDPAQVGELCGDGLKAVLTAPGEDNGLGGPLVTKVLTDKVRELTGGYFIVDLDPDCAAEKLLAAIEERRAGLGLSVPGGGRR